MVFGQYHRIGNKQKGHSGRMWVCVPTQVALHVFVMQVLVSQWHFLTKENSELAFPPLTSPVNCIKIGGSGITELAVWLYVL